MLLYLLALLGALRADSVTLDIRLPAGVRVGHPVPITLRVTNTGATPLTLYLQGRPASFDVIVSRRDGTVVWRRLEGAVISAILQVRTLAPAETLELQDTWDQKTNRGEPVGPDDYVVTGVLPTDPPAELRSTPVPLRITP
jgi:hypothetical protein